MYQTIILILIFLCLGCQNWGQCKDFNQVIRLQNDSVYKFEVNNFSFNSSELIHPNECMIYLEIVNNSLFKISYSEDIEEKKFMSNFTDTIILGKEILRYNNSSYYSNLFKDEKYLIFKEGIFIKSSTYNMRNSQYIDNCISISVLSEFDKTLTQILQRSIDLSTFNNETLHLELAISPQNVRIKNNGATNLDLLNEVCHTLYNIQCWSFNHTRVKQPFLDYVFITIEVKNNALTMSSIETKKIW